MSALLFIIFCVCVVSKGSRQTNYFVFLFPFEEEINQKSFDKNFENFAFDFSQFSWFGTTNGFVCVKFSSCGFPESKRNQIKTMHDQ